MSELPRKIVTGFSNGKEIGISVSYPWLPPKCKIYGRYGHDDHQCKQNTQTGTVWRRKSSRSRSRPSRRRRHSKGSVTEAASATGEKQQIDKDESEPSTRQEVLEEGCVDLNPQIHEAITMREAGEAETKMEQEGEENPTARMDGGPAAKQNHLD